MSIDALVHSNPTSPSNTTSPPVADHHSPPPGQYRPDPKSRKPPIEKYFTLPQSLIAQGRKRRRSEADRTDEGRRMQNQTYT